VLWFRDALPELFARTWKFLLWHEYVLVRLGLEPSLDYPNASRTLALDIRTGEWSSEILDYAGINAELFAPLARPGSVAGSIRPRVANELGLEPGTLVAVGGFDQCCAALGAGVTGDLEASVGTGSVEALVISLRVPPIADRLREGHFAVCPHVIPDSFVLIGTSFAAGSLVRWFIETMGGERSPRARAGEQSAFRLERGQSAFDLELGSLPEQPSRLLVLPHLNGAFSPVRDPRSRAAILGLRQDTTRSEIARAILEGTAFELRAMLDCVSGAGLQPTRLRASGGGARSPAWLQIKADVLSRAIEVPAVHDAACLGAAVLATAALDHERDIADISREMVRIDSVVEPDSARAALYNERYSAYCQLYSATAPLHHAL
jgi:xylulokinase